MIEDDARRLLQRQDVAEVRQVDQFLYVTNDLGKEGGPFVTYTEATSWLIGDDHLVGMALCACSCCVPDIWKNKK